MKFFNTAAAFLSLTLAFSASAHVSLKHSTPEQEAMLMQSPELLTLTFSGEVRLAKVKLSDSKDQAIDFAFKPNATPSAKFSWPLPSLAQGNYTVQWLVLGDDGHKMSGSFNFMLHGNQSMMKNMDKKLNTHSQHNH